MANKNKCAKCGVEVKCKLCTCKAYYCPDHITESEHDHLAMLELKSKQSLVGKSNVRRSKTHERTIAKFLTDWTGREFRRRRVEGRDSTVIERESTSDVISVKGMIHCSVEAKCGEVQTFAALMTNPTGCKFTQWWHQVNYDTVLLADVLKFKFYPMLFFRPYVNQNWIAISLDIFTDGVLKSRNGLSNLSFPHFVFDNYKNIGDISFNVVRTKEKKNYKYVPLKLPAVVICRWQDFADHINPESFFME